MDEKTVEGHRRLDIPENRRYKFLKNILGG